MFILNFRHQNYYEIIYSVNGAFYYQFLCPVFWLVNISEKMTFGYSGARHRYWNKQTQTDGAQIWSMLSNLLLTWPVHDERQP